jgi:hypothetical protein
MPTTFPLVINKNDVVAGDNSSYIYRFPRGSINFKNASVALMQCNLYYSWGNINAALYNNNQFQIIFPDGTPNTFTEYTVTIPDGNYTVQDLNRFLQSFFVANNKYHINATTGAFRYYYEITTNPNTYKIQLVASEIPTSLPSGFNNPPGGFSYPSQASQQPSLVVMPNNNFGRLIGFSQGAYFDASSNLVPEMSPVSTVFIRCSLLNNKFTNPNDIIYGFTTANTTYGSMMQLEPQNLVFNKIEDGTRTEVKIHFTDQDNMRLNIIDTALVIILLIQIDD